MPSFLQVLPSTISASLGIVFNGYILLVLLWNHHIHTANRILLLHLAFVDTVFCLVILFYNTSVGVLLGASHSLNPAESILPEQFIQFCQSHGFVWTVLPIVVVWNVCALSCDRYAAISIPLHYSRLVNARRAFYFVLASWLLGVTLASPPLLGICPYAFRDARWACAATCTPSKEEDMSYAITSVTFALVLPFTIILICNFHMLIIARYHRHRIATAIYEMTLSAHATITHQRNPSCYLSKFKGKNAFLTIFQLVGSLTLLTVPYYSILLWEAFCGSGSNTIVVSIATFLLTCTPPVNAYVYGVKSRVLRQTLKRLLKRYLHPNQTNQDIKYRLSEIFSDPESRPLPSRRMSAPAGCYRKNSKTASTPTISKECDIMLDPSGKASTKRLFNRSNSLPVTELRNCIIENNFKPPKKTECQNTENSKNKSRNRILVRGDSAPESDAVIILEHVNSPDQNKDKTAQHYRRHKTFVKSLSFPETEEPSVQKQKRHVITNIIVSDLKLLQRTESSVSDSSTVAYEQNLS